MTRFVLSLMLALVLVVPVGSSEAMVGTVVRTSQALGSGVTKYTLVWTSAAGGAVSGNPFAVPQGSLLSVKFVPGTAASQPTDNYDITLVDQNAIDLLDGNGANLSNSTAALFMFDPLFFVDGSQTLDLVVANAGDTKSGTVYLWLVSK